MVTIDVELELAQQLKEAGKQLSNRPGSVDGLLYVLDQTEKLLQKVDQSPNSLMQEALVQPMKALVDESLLEHSNVDVRVSVASCICEITRITAPDAPYTDDEMKGVFRCIVSSFEDLSDETSRSYSKRASILDIVCKVRSCVIMLDLECDDLIVKMFEHFLNSVRDHHLDRVFSLMSNIMVLVIEESEDPSLDMLRPVMASIKNNSEGILPVARKLGEEVIKKSADKLRPHLKQFVNILGGSLDDYSQVLTSIIKGTTDVVEHNDEIATVQPETVETNPKIVLSDDAAQVTSNGNMVTVNEGGSDDKESRKPEEAAVGHEPEVVDHQPDEVVGPQPDEIVDHPGSNLTSKLDINDSVTELANVESNKETTSTMKSTEPSESSQLGENKTDKLINILFSVKKGIRSKKTVPRQIEAPSTDIGLTKAAEITSDSEMRSPKRARKKTPKFDDDKPLAPGVSNVELLKKSRKVNIVNLGSKKKSSSQTDAPAPSTDIGLTKTPEITSDPDVRSPKRARKKTPKAADYKAASGSDLEILKKSTKKVASGSKKKISSRTDRPSVVIGLKKVAEDVTDSEMKSPKRARKKTQKAEDNKPSATSDSDDKLLKKSRKKVEKVDSGSKPVKRSGKKVVAESLEDKPSATNGSDVEPVDSGSNPVKSSGKKAGVAELVEDKDKSSATSGSDAEPLKKSNTKVETVDSGSKPVKRSGKKVGSGNSVAKKRKLSGKKESEPKKRKLDVKKVGAGDSEVKSSKQSLKKDNGSDSDAKPLKTLAGKKRASKTIVKPSEDILHRDEESDSDDETETDSDNQPIRQPAKKGNKSGSSMVKSSSNNKVGKKRGLGKDVEEKDEAKSLSEDDGMDVSLKSALKAVKRKVNLKEAVSTASKQKQSVGKNKATESIKYDDSLVGEKIKVWWPMDKIYYEGVIKSFDASKNKHKVLYLDEATESLNLKKEKWEFINEYSEAQNTDILPETTAAPATSGKSKGRASKSAGGSNGESKLDDKEGEKQNEDDEVTKSVPNKKAEPQKIVYKSRGRKGSKSKAKTVEIDAKSNAAETVDAKSPENVKESVAEEAVDGEESEKKP